MKAYKTKIDSSFRQVKVAVKPKVPVFFKEESTITTHNNILIMLPFRTNKSEGFSVFRPEYRREFD